MAIPLFITLNGAQVPLGDVDPDVTALAWIRSQGLTGAKEGCAEGECGACAVLVVKPSGPGPCTVDATSGAAAHAAAGAAAEAVDAAAASRWTAVNACLVPVGALAGQEVRTAEGLGTPADLHPVQRELAARGGSQCGYCTPGFVCSMAAEFYRPGRCAAGAGHDARAADADTAARATDAAAEHTDPATQDTVGRASSTQKSVTPHGSDPNDPAAHEHGPNGFDLHALSGNLCRCTGYRPIRDAAFALGAPDTHDPIGRRQSQAAPAAHDERIEGPSGTFARPASLPDALRLLRAEPEAAVVAGSTDRGVEVNLRGLRSRLVIGIDRLPQLRELHVDEDAIEIGAGLSLSEIERGLAGRVPLLDELWPQFASRLIRNSATLGGNLGTGSPIGDSPPVLLALRAQLVLADADGERTVEVADYFTGYRRSVRRHDELIRSVRIPLPTARLVAFHKIAKRRFDDISSVAVAFALDVDAGGIVEAARIGLGGVAATPIRATACEEALVGRPWDAATVEAAAPLLAGAGTPMDDHRASSAYRSAMLGTALRKLYAQHPTPQEVSA